MAKTDTQSYSHLDPPRTSSGMAGEEGKGERNMLQSVVKHEVRNLIRKVKLRRGRTSFLTGTTKKEREAGDGEGEDMCGVRRIWNNEFAMPDTIEVATWGKLN